MNVSKLLSKVTAGAAVLSALAACAAKEEAAPAPIAVDVEFPSAAAAVAVDSVKLYVFDGAQDCAELIRRRQIQQELPPFLLETPAASPCDFQRGQNNTFELDLAQTYSVLAVGDRQGGDLLVGCAKQTSFGDTKALPISLTFLDATKRVPDTTCTKLSDKCAGTCN